ncbi:transmembrane protein 207 isoform X2 [Perognathus longimembris pacificus]|uniref:transmembrane protein 207 isoform X2 n=1 Tax=Perognathus longimembris pacificus TaxID=214514 RepID=UPI00201971BC|nr:transmembrane protein 207 isoform X2 [Perognathus longimembris pacificus]
MSRSRGFRVTAVISAVGTLCTPLFQLVLSDLLCEENEMCVNYDEHPNVWYIWFLLLIFLAALLCGVVLFCLQCWLKGPMILPQRRTMAVFAVGDLDNIYETEAAVRPTVGAHLHTQNHDLYPLPCFGTLDSPPPYEEIIKTSQL